MVPRGTVTDIESGIVYLEPVIKACATLEEFRAKVPRGTLGEMRHEEFTKVRNNVLSGEGLGIVYLEPVIKSCATLEEFRVMVPRGTITDMEPKHYQNVRNNVLSGEGLGVKFLSRELPPALIVTL